MSTNSESIRKFINAQLSRDIKSNQYKTLQTTEIVFASLFYLFTFAYFVKSKYDRREEYLNTGYLILVFLMLVGYIIFLGFLGVSLTTDFEESLIGIFKYLKGNLFNSSISKETIIRKINYLEAIVNDSRFEEVINVNKFKVDTEMLNKNKDYNKNKEITKENIGLYLKDKLKEINDRYITLVYLSKGLSIYVIICTLIILCIFMYLLYSSSDYSMKNVYVIFVLFILLFMSLILSSLQFKFNNLSN